MTCAWRRLSTQDIYHAFLFLARAESKLTAKAMLHPETSNSIAMVT